MRTPIRNVKQFLYGIAFVFLIFILNGCNKPPQKSISHIPDRKSPHYDSVNNFDSTQIIFWHKGEANDAFRQFQINFEETHKGVKKLECGNCNGNAIIYQGDDIPTYYQGQTTSSGGSSSGKTTTGVTGDSVYWCANFILKNNDSSAINNQKFIKLPPPKKKEYSKTVAVFDTGIDTTGIPNEYFYVNDTRSCLGNGSNNGWNFVDNTPNWQDNNAERHGTVVTRFIINEVNAYNDQTGIKILPIKTHDQEGNGDLFGILCAIAYAADRKADIINASFGFYRNKNLPFIDSAKLFLKEYVNYYLTQHNILLIAAAGNVTPEHSERNLNDISFYPASLSNELSNVIAVTTVNKEATNVDERQNYSDTIVSIGVKADTVIASSYDRGVQNGMICLFSNPLIANNYIRGTSFATPIATGNLCAHYHLYGSLIGSGGFTNTGILSEMNSAGFIISPNVGLIQYIAGTNAMPKKSVP